MGRETVIPGGIGRVVIEPDGEGIKVSVEPASGRRRRAEKGIKTMPAGAIETLQPLLRKIIPEENLGADEDYYWVEMERPDQHQEIRKQCAKLRTHGWNHLDVAEVLVNTSPRVRQGLALGAISKEDVESYIARLGEVIRPYYSTRKPLGRK